MADIVSRVYQPNPEKCCEACCFGRGKHSEWCETSRTAYERYKASQKTLPEWVREYRLHREQISRP